MRAGDGCTRQVRVNLQTEDVREAWVSPQLDALAQSECTCGGCFRCFEMKYVMPVMALRFCCVLVGCEAVKNIVCLFLLFTFFSLLHVVMCDNLCVCY